MHNHKSGWGMICSILVVIGGLNWGIIGVGMLMNADWNLVSMIFGDGMVASIIYILVGIATLCVLGSMRSKKAEMAKPMGGQQM